MAEPIRLRALSISELVDEAVAIYRRRFLVFAGVALALTIPGLAATLLSGSFRSLDPFIGFFQAASNPARTIPVAPEYNWGLVGLSYVIGAVMAPLAGFSFAPAPALVAAAMDVAHGRESGMGAAIAAALRRYWALLGLMIVLSLASPLLCLLPLAIWIFTAWSVAVPVLLEERAGIGTSLSRSWNLVRGNWWRVFGILVVTAAMGTAVELAVGGVLGIGGLLLPGVSNGTRAALFVIGTALGGVAVRPVLPIVSTLIYYDLRVRAEALDLDQLAATVPSAPALAGS